MNKGIIVKSGIVLVILGAVHSVFWFFKTGQTEKQINNFISENSLHVSAGEIAVSGFPLKQTVTIKDLRFSVPNPAFNKYQITARSLQATAGIFDEDFIVSINDQISIQDNDSNISGVVEFSKEPEIKTTLANGMIMRFSYQDFGHRVLDGEKNVIYASAGANIALESALEEGDKIKTKITANIKDIEGFDILSLYKNSSEKKVIEGIKTGEITIGNSVTLTPTDPTQTVTTAPATNLVAPIISATAQATPATPAAQADAAAPAKPEDMSATVSNNLVKSNFSMDAEYALTPVQSGEQQVQTDPTQIQETPIQYSKLLKINNMEFSNPLYKITINGQIDTFQDDSLPSGAITIKVEKIDNFVNHVVAGLNQIADQKKPANSLVQSADLNANNVAPSPAAPTPATTADAPTPTPTAPTIADNSVTVPVIDDSYQIFLKRFAAGLPTIAKEVSTKNQLSKDDLSIFDIRREKNLDVLINETPTREILGKF